MEYIDIDSMFEYCFVYDNGIKCLNVSILKNGYCNNHQQYANDITKFDNVNNSYCIDIINKYICDLTCTSNQSKKKIMILNLYEFLLVNKRFVYLHHNFANTIFRKLIDLREEELLIDYYIQTLFPYYK